jgi:hypothetical protein
MTLDFIQIYYDDSQLEKIYPFARPYKNTELTPYFENSVIEKVVPESNADLISVCSWRLMQKRGDMWRLKDKTLTEEKILSADFDIAVLTPRSPAHQPLSMASQWHGEAWDKGFAHLKDFLREELKIRVPVELTNTIYENHFIAKRSIYHSYVNTCLSPAIRHMEESGSYLEDSGYARRKNSEERKRYTEATGRQDWPIAPFLLERLFSIWIEGKGYKVIPL